MTTLERRCRLLLRAYPAAYWEEHGEEILGTLLEATPAGRSWPLAREIRCLATGSLRARAALNRQQTTAANLRIAAFVGATAYLAYSAVSNLYWVVLTLVVWAPARPHQQVWPPLLIGVLVGVAVALAWFSSRRAVVLAGALAAAAAVAISFAGYGPHVIGLIATDIACLAVLALHAGRAERPGVRRLWPLGLVAAYPLTGYFMPGSSVTLFLALLETLGIVSLLWIVIDARPAVAMSVFALALWLTPTIGIMAAGMSPDIAAEVPLMVVGVLAAIAVWLLRRQSARITPRGDS